MNKELIVSGFIGLILAWAAWKSNFLASIFAGIIGLIALVFGIIE